MSMPERLIFEDVPDAPLWGVDDATLDLWPTLTPGKSVTIAKWSVKHDGEERARYPATVLDVSLPSPWLAFETQWTMGTHDQGLLTFEDGDILHEVFSPIHPFDAFAVYRSTVAPKGWYANVTYPAFFASNSNEPVIVWNDLFIDIVATPDGNANVLDEDELEDAGLLKANPDLHRRILDARDELLTRFEDRRPPFLASTHPIP